MITFDAWLAEQRDYVRTLHVATGEYTVFKRERESYGRTPVYTVAAKTKSSTHQVVKIDRDADGKVKIYLSRDGVHYTFVPWWSMRGLIVQRVVPGRWVDDAVAAEMALATLRHAAEIVYNDHKSATLGMADENTEMLRLARSEMA